MARRPDPERLYEAHRAGHLSRLIAESRLSPEAAEEWLNRWEDEAALRGLDRRSELFWRGCWDWIAQKGRLDLPRGLSRPCRRSATAAPVKLAQRSLR